MDLKESSWHLADLIEHSDFAYLKVEPEVPDFTSGQEAKVIVEGAGNRRVELQLTPENAISVLALLDVTIFETQSLRMLFCWNLKALMSYFYRFVPKFVKPTVSLIDIQCIENFLNIKKNQPKNLVEALNRGKICSKLPAWKPVYQKIHLPLVLRVLPSLETTPLLSQTERKPVYAYYEIEGQFNGRMNNYGKYGSSYLPYTMGPDVRSSLKPRGDGVRFVTADFRGCEVAVLQWLSKDKGLLEVLDSKDIHRAMYEKLTSDPCNTDQKRKMSKLLFLPVMYGMGPTGTSKRLGIPENTAKELIFRIRKLFPEAWDWIYQKQLEAKNRGRVEDHFGRPRIIEADKSYLARNFSVQGVAATVCLEKLIALHARLIKAAYVCFSIHDGYGMVCTDIKQAKNVYDSAKAILEEESKMCEGLKMGVEVKFGARLTEMKTLWRD